MREILFRGKQTNTGKWVYGYFLNWMYNGEKSARISDSDTELWQIYQVEPDTVGQYTGLKDSKGNKVFEGDIVKLYDNLCNETYYGFIMFGNPEGEYNWGFQIVPIDFLFNTDILHWFDMEESGAFSEVIGNIYDNPELLEGK